MQGVPEVNIRKKRPKNTVGLESTERSRRQYRPRRVRILFVPNGSGVFQQRIVRLKAPVLDATHAVVRNGDEHHVIVEVWTPSWGGVFTLYNGLSDDEMSNA
jgi:hypothetical protein